MKPVSLNSKEIAARTGKRHDHVLRDIRVLVMQLHPEVSSHYKELLKLGQLDGLTFVPDYRGMTKYIILDERHTFALLAGYDPWLRIEAADIMAKHELTAGGSDRLAASELLAEIVD